MRTLRNILRWLTALFVEDEPERDEYEGYDTSSHMED